MKEHNIDYSSFIGGWYIPENVCDELIELYNSEKDNWLDGQVAGDSEVKHQSKKSTEIFIKPNEFIKLSTYLPHLSTCLVEYRKKYPFCDNVSAYDLNKSKSIKIQHYKPSEGFYQWHNENLGIGEESNRHLVFMTYLNTLDNAGTEFYHQKIKTPCQKGLTIIWPAHWTHTHRGVINYDSDKYIITGWYCFNG